MLRLSMFLVVYAIFDGLRAHGSWMTGISVFLHRHIEIAQSTVLNPQNAYTKRPSFKVTLSYISETSRQSGIGLRSSANECVIPSNKTTRVVNCTLRRQRQPYKPDLFHCIRISHCCTSCSIGRRRLGQHRMSSDYARILREQGPAACNQRSSSTSIKMSQRMCRPED